MTQTIDITPTWEGLLPLLVEVAANGTTVEARKNAMDELLRLARRIDALNAKVAQQPQPLSEIVGIPMTRPHKSL